MRIIHAGCRAFITLSNRKKEWTRSIAKGPGRSKKESKTVVGRARCYVRGSPATQHDKKSRFSFLSLPLVDLPRVKSYERTDGQVTQTDAAHLSRFEMSDEKGRARRG